MLDLVTDVLFSLVLYSILHANPSRPRYRQIAHQDAAPHLHSVRKSHAGHVLTVSMARRTSAAYSNPLCGSGWLVHRLLLYAYVIYLLFESRTKAIRDWIEPKLFPPASALGLSTTEFVGFGSLQREAGAGEESADSGEASTRSIASPPVAP
jgi:hypothetical protein